MYKRQSLIYPIDWAKSLGATKNTSILSTSRIESRFWTATISSIKTISKLKSLATSKKFGTPNPCLDPYIPLWPIGANLPPETTFSASSLVFTCGTTIPWAPKSKVLYICPWEFSFILTIEVNPQRSQALVKSPTLLGPTNPCSPSSQIPSIPASTAACPNASISVAWEFPEAT